MLTVAVCYHMTECNEFLWHRVFVFCSLCNRLRCVCLLIVETCFAAAGLVYIIAASDACSGAPAWIHIHAARDACLTASLVVVS